MKKRARIHHQELNTLKTRSQQYQSRSTIRWVFVCVLCLFTFICMLGIASAAQNSKPLTLAQKEQGVQRLINIGRAHLRPKPTNPQPPPPQAAPTLQAGISNLHQSLLGSSFALANSWQGPVGSTWELVYAGGNKDPQNNVGPGALVLFTVTANLSGGFDIRNIGTYTAPDGARILTIVAVNGDLMQLRTDSGGSLVFNLKTKTFSQA